MREGRDLTAICYGTMTGEVLSAAQRLAEEGVQVEVIKLNQLVPLVPELALQSVRKTRRLLVAEEVVVAGFHRNHTVRTD